MEGVVLYRVCILRLFCLIQSGVVYKPNPKLVVYHPRDKSTKSLKALWKRKIKKKHGGIKKKNKPDYKKVDIRF